MNEKSMQLYQVQKEFTTTPYSLLDLSDTCSLTLGESKLSQGLMHLFLQHTSASFIIQENADPDVLRDLATFMSKLVPESGNYLHADEGPDDMPAHIRTALTQTQLSIPFINGKLQLGRWQAVYLWEHRSKSHKRSVVFSLQGR